MIIGGTSLNVYPAASFINYFRGRYLVLINKSITQYDHICNLVNHDSIGKVLESIEKSLFQALFILLNYLIHQLIIL